MTTGIEILQQFALGFWQFIVDSLLNIPVSVSIASAITITFIWLFSEITSIIKAMRAIVISIWALVLGRSFTAAELLQQYTLWIFVASVVVLNLILVVKKRRRGGKLMCKACGNTKDFVATLTYKNGRLSNILLKTCAVCNSMDIVGLAPK